MEETKGQDILLRDVPGEIVAWLERRAAQNFRSRYGELMAILTALSRSDATLPGLGVGEMIPGGAK